MPVNFRKIQQTYPDALKFTATITKGFSPVGEEGMARLVGGGKVLHYAVRGNKETIIVSIMAQGSITIIYGPQGSGKTTKARELADQYAPEEQAHYEYGWLIGGECIVPPRTKIVVIDGFPLIADTSRLKNSFISAETGKFIPVHAVYCVQVQSDRTLIECPDFKYIKMPKS